MSQCCWICDSWHDSQWMQILLLFFFENQRHNEGDECYWETFRWEEKNSMELKVDWIDRPLQHVNMKQSFCNVVCLLVKPNILGENHHKGSHDLNIYWALISQNCTVSNINILLLEMLLNLCFWADWNVCDGDLSVCTIWTTSQMERLPDTQSVSSFEAKCSLVFLYQSIRDQKKPREKFPFLPERSHETHSEHCTGFNWKHNREINKQKQEL